MQADMPQDELMNELDDSGDENMTVIMGGDEDEMEIIQGSPPSSLAGSEALEYGEDEDGYDADDEGGEDEDEDEDEDEGDVEDEDEGDIDID